ncbi:IclR family transcriptional regulator domain-containing protein [Gordonia humi]|uniref:DNA-binding IclR family transcriptional regulator n=1 Tax=Gordonia humi TaxID=686429 RepID=A0A840ETV1_9ACTN|nr:DNA-binding IclR family transcriptional regulator [Gordonia humi]
MLSTVARTGRVLNLFTSDRPEWGVREAAEILGLPKSNTHELMASMARIGLLRRTAAGRYRLGWRLLTMSSDLLSGSGLEAKAEHLVHRFSAHVGEIITVGAWDGLHVVCVACAGPHGGALDCRAGSILPGHATALGKLLMAGLPDDATEDIVARFGMPKLTAETVDDVPFFERQLEAIRGTGMAYEHSEYVPGYDCVATGVYHRSDLVAAVSVAAPEERFAVRREEFGAAARGIARLLSESLGASRPADTGPPTN